MTPEALLRGEGLTSPANQPFARELWVTDPATLLAQLTTFTGRLTAL